MTTKKKVTKKELQQIQDQQTQLNALQYNIANLEVRKLEYVDELKRTNVEISDLKKKLEKKYGSVNINLETGEVTPIENEQDNKKN
tara:strand:- start:522 stop:779 length:258 start_codon:yes stop_codon:yes gene_type:complete